MDLQKKMPTWWMFWNEHGLALVFYLALAIVFTWPLARAFTTQFIGVGTGDPKHNIWMVWNVKQWMLGRQALFHSSQLYYPYGTPLIMDGVGPIVGLFALPFWIWGPEAAYNGAILVSVWLSGYCMYLFARSLGFTRDLALFAGIVLQTSPAHIAGIYGHVEKTFVGFLPLALLSLHNALNPQKKWGWAAMTGLMLLLTALYSGYQFVYAAFAVAFFMLALFLLADRSRRWQIVRRIALVGAWSVILVGPFLIAIILTTSNPLFKSNLKVNLSSPYYSPDALQLLLPSFYHQTAPWFHIFAPGSDVPYKSRIGGLERSNAWYGTWIETAITLPLTTLILAAFAIRNDWRNVRSWLLFTVLVILLSLGPILRIFGITHFTVYQIPILLPYALITSLPGFDFMRVPGRWNMLSAVGLAIVASYGLRWICRRWPAHRRVFTALAILMLLLESLPRPWPQSTLPLTPRFYQQLASDTGNYGVLDLPVGTPEYASTYQIYQMSHGKGIAWGHLSHTYTKHPIPLLSELSDDGATLPDIRINGSAVNPFANAQTELARLGYRYVVWHKTLSFKPNGANDQQVAADFIDATFGSQSKPIVDDDLVRVYQITPSADASSLQPSIQLISNWYPANPADRWATSPAVLNVDSPIQQCVNMEIIPAGIYDPASTSGLGYTGVLNIQSAQGPPISFPITADQMAVVPLSLPQGSQAISLTLQSGNFQPSAYGGADTSLLSFSIRSINIQQTECSKN